MSEPLATVMSLARRLPVDMLDALSRAALGGADGLRALRAESGSSPVRDACNRLIQALTDDGGPAGCSRPEPLFLAGALAAAGEAERRRQRSSVEVVWTGPDTAALGTRLTLAVVTDLIAQARRELLLVSYAAHTDPHLAAALEAASARGVSITLLLERTEDNPDYESWGGAPFPTVVARRLAWPSAQRPPRASLHAKVLVVDDEIALVGSANLTSRAMEDNLECGLLVRDRAIAGAVRAHFLALEHLGVLAQ